MNSNISKDKNKKADRNKLIDINRKNIFNIKYKKYKMSIAGVCIAAGLSMAVLAACSGNGDAAVNATEYSTENGVEYSTEYSAEYVTDEQGKQVLDGQDNDETGGQGEGATDENGEVVTGGQGEGATDENGEAVTGKPAAGGQNEFTAQPQKVRGIFVTGPMAGSSYMDGLIELIDDTELNAVVIDVKNDDGRITYSMQLEQAQNMDACVRYIYDIESFMQKLKEHEIYTIARIVCFKDSVYAAAYPDCAIKNQDGTMLTDNSGAIWLNPYKREIWDYIVDVALMASDAGFDEIQFDYVRFPSGKSAQTADYGVDTQQYSKIQVITDFITYASEKLHENNIILGADVFGTIIESDTDAAIIGQDYMNICGIADIVSPMVYPSHYNNGAFGLSVPDAYPYDTVYRAMKDSAEKLQVIETENRAVIRPWIQAFTATWVGGHISYGGEQIRQQIQAIYDAGYDEWILWNSSNKYSRDGLEMGE